MNIFRLQSKLQLESRLESLVTPAAAFVEHAAILSIRGLLLESLHGVPNSERRAPLSAFDKLLFAQSSPLPPVSDLQSLEPTLHQTLPDATSAQAVLRKLSEALARQHEIVKGEAKKPPSQSDGLAVHISAIDSDISRVSWADPLDRRRRASFSVRSDRLRWLAARFRRERERLGAEPDAAAFRSCLFALLARYDAVGAAGHQAAVPADVFRALHRSFPGAPVHELFARQPAPSRTAVTRLLWTRKSRRNSARNRPAQQTLDSIAQSHLRVRQNSQPSCGLLHPLRNRSAPCRRSTATKSQIRIWADPEPPPRSRAASQQLGFGPAHGVQS